MRTWKNRDHIALSALCLASALMLVGCPEKPDDKLSLPAKPAAPAKPTVAVGDAMGVSPSSPPSAGIVKSSAVAESVVGETSTPSAPATLAVMRLSGQVTATRASKIAFEVTGFVKDVVAKPGTQLKKGDVLATLDDDDFKLKVELATSRRELAKVGLAAAKKELERERQLKAENASTASVLDKVENGFEQARLQLRIAELDLTQAERALADTKLRAPYDCIVATQLKFEGEYVQSSNVAFELVDTGSPEISFDAPEALFGKLEVGRHLAVAVPAGGFKGQAEIVRLVPVIAEKTRTFRVIAKLPDGAARVAPGSYAEAKVD